MNSTTVNPVTVPAEQLAEDAPWLFEDVPEPSHVMVHFEPPINPDTSGHAALASVDEAVQELGRPVRRQEAVDFGEHAYSTASIGGAIQGLFKLGLLVRQADDEHGRLAYAYSLSQLGEQVLEEFEE